MADDKINTQSDNLFQVCEGIAAEDALNWAQCYLGAALDVSISAAELNNQDTKGWGAVYLVEAAKALVDSAVASMHADAKKAAEVSA
jgi:hypothetical protein